MVTKIAPKKQEWKDIPGVWQRVGQLLFSLMEDCYRRGEMTYANRVWLSVEFHPSVSDDERARILDDIHMVLDMDVDVSDNNA